MGEEHDESTDGTDGSCDGLPGAGGVPTPPPGDLPGSLPQPPPAVPRGSVPPPSIDWSAVPQSPYGERPTRSPWTGVGVVLSIVLILFGLGLIGIVVLFFVSLSSWGSHK